MLIPGTDVRVSGGATEEEAVAVLLALDLAARQDAAGRRVPRVSGWQRAARLEGVGRPPIASPPELRNP